MTHPREWTASELFNSLIGSSVIAADEMFEDWMNDRSLMIEMMVNDMVENGIDPDSEEKEENQ